MLTGCYFSLGQSAVNSQAVRKQDKMNRVLALGHIRRPRLHALCGKMTTWRGYRSNNSQVLLHGGPGHYLDWYTCPRYNNHSTTHVNSVLHPSGISKSSTGLPAWG